MLQMLPASRLQMCLKRVVAVQESLREWMLLTPKVAAMVAIQVFAPELMLQMLELLEWVRAAVVTVELS